MNKDQKEALSFLTRYNSKDKSSILIENSQLNDTGAISKYSKDLSTASTIFTSEYQDLAREEIIKCIKFATEEASPIDVNDATAKLVGKLQKTINTYLNKAMMCKPEFIVYPITNLMGVIPEHDCSPIELQNINNPNSVINSKIKISNIHGYNKSKFINWSLDIKHIFQGLIRIFSAMLGYKDVRHVIYYHSFEESLGATYQAQVSINDRLEEHESFSFIHSNYKNVWKKVTEHQFNIVINYLLSQPLFKNNYASNALHAIERFNSAIITRNNNDTVVNLCSSLESFANRLHKKEVCNACSNRKVSEGLKEFLNKNAFKFNDTYKSKEPERSFRKLYKLRSNVVHGSLTQEHSTTLKEHLPELINFVATTLVILLHQTNQSGFEIELPKE